MSEANLVFLNGDFFASRPSGEPVELVAVRGDRIVAVGDRSDSPGLIGRHTEVVDLQGGLLTPGFIDAHVHTATSGLEQLRLTFDECDGAAEAIQAIARYAGDHPDLPWVIGGGWSQSWFARGCPPRETLDAVVSDRPVILTNSDGHGAWVNTKALEVAGITATTPDPPDGRIERREDGTPQGTLHEGAKQLVARHAPDDTVADFERGLARGQEEMLRHGITGWQEAAVPVPVQRAYLNAAAAGSLLGDVVGALWWERDRGMEQVEEMVERREQSAPRFRPTAVKLMLDGVAENFTASVLGPYLDGEGRPTTNLGVDFIDPGQLREIVTALDLAGFQCHFHSLGDRAVRNALDAVEAARRANGPSDNRHHLAHIQFVDRDDIPRFARLGAVANAQPFWACNDDYQIELTRPFVSEDRYLGQYPFGSLIRSGARLGMGSDWNVSTANVMAEIDVAVTRTGPSGGEPLGVGEAISGAQALNAFTMGSAFINHSEADRGSIEPGKKADLVVLDCNPLREGRFRDATVSMTFIEGRLVYGG